MTVSPTDRDERWWYRLGGISALVLGVAYVITIPLYAHVGAPPTDAAEWLKYGAQRTAEWWVILGLSVLTDALYIPLGLALYLALRRESSAATLLALAFVGLFIVLDLAVTWSNYASLITLSGQYASATTDSQRSEYVAAAAHATSVLYSRLEVVYSIVDLSVGIFVIGLVMLRSPFNRTAAYAAIATGLLGIFAITGFSPLIIANAVVATIWVLLTGYKLVRLGTTETLTRH